MDEHIELDVRRRIYNCIVSSPGLHFREIQRRVSLATGSLDYHLHFMHKHGLVRTEKVGKFLRYYTLTKNWEQEEKEVLSLLRQEKIRHIIIFLLEHKKPSASDIAAGISTTPSTLSWYLKQLAEKNIITQTKKGRFRFYRLVNKEKMIKYLVAHKTSFLDNVVDKFISAWEEE